jgi:hypothetical protein
MSKGKISEKEGPIPKVQAVVGPLLVSDLGWSPEETQETRSRLIDLEEDWDAPGMEAYDRL